MSRAKGYKCFNIKCGRCIGKTLCGEPEDTALVCVDRDIGKPMTNADRIRAMSDKELAELMRSMMDCDSCGNMFSFKCDGSYEHCSSVCLKWLQQPAEDGTL